MMKKQNLYIDIFAGCGGLSTGLLKAGWTGLFAVEKNADAFSTLEHKFSYANNDKYLLSVADRLDIIQAVLPLLLSNYNLPDTFCPSDFKDYYIDKINVYRNKLGHIKFGEKLIQIKGKDVEINQDLHRFLRKNIAEVDATISKIENHITQSM